MSSSDRHSRLIRQLRFMLPIIVAIMLVALLVWPAFDATRSLADQAGDGETEMVNASFFTLDDKNRPVSIRAARVRQVGDARDLVQVQLPEADILLQDGGWVGINAQAGTYDQVARSLTLKDRVNVHHADGWEINTDIAVLHIKTRQATGHLPVTVQGPLGHITGEGFAIDGTGGKLTITGKTKLVLYPDDNWSLGQ